MHHLLTVIGIMATPWNLTRDGFETQLGTNHLGHALLTKLLLPIMVKTAELPDADIRIVSVSSIGHNMAPKGGILFDQEAMKGLTPAQLYGQSKLANILYVKALAKRHPQITAVAVHPGLIRTDLYDPVARDIWLVRFALKAARPLVFSDVGYGALNQLWAAAVGKESVQNGAYYMPVGKPIGASPYTNDEQLADKLWDWTEKQFTRHATGNKTTKSS
jgi:NAD(P)-dependent dehydrogenase (short-subunit alcohol dehydrogenase family)